MSVNIKSFIWITRRSSSVGRAEAGEPCVGSSILSFSTVYEWNISLSSLSVKQKFFGTCGCNSRHTPKFRTAKFISKLGINLDGKSGSNPPVRANIRAWCNGSIAAFEAEGT